MIVPAVTLEVVAKDKRYMPYLNVLFSTAAKVDELWRG
jgi:hypothetical protein